MVELFLLDKNALDSDDIGQVFQLQNVHLQHFCLSTVTELKYPGDCLICTMNNVRTYDVCMI